MVVLSLLTSFLLAIDVRPKFQPVQRVWDGNLATDGIPQVLHSENWSGSAWNKTQVRSGQS